MVIFHLDQWQKTTTCNIVYFLEKNRQKTIKISLFSVLVGLYEYILVDNRFRFHAISIFYNRCEIIKKKKKRKKFKLSKVSLIETNIETSRDHMEGWENSWVQVQGDGHGWE